MLETSLIDPATGIRQFVGPHRAALVESRALPPVGTPLDAIIFRGFLENDAGSNDMTVLGSVADPEIFSFRSSSRGDVYIKSMSFLITGDTMTLGDFGSIVALANGCILRYRTEIEEVVISNDITTNFQLMRLGGELMPGVGGTVVDALKVGSPAMGMETQDAYVAYIDFHRVFGVPFGLRLAGGTEQQINFVIQDDITGVDTFDCEVLGFIRLPDTVKA